MVFTNLGPVGWFANKIKVEASKTVNEFSRLSSDEQYTLMTLWSIFKSPLMIGGNLLDMDKPTLKLITNKEVLGMNQTSINPIELRYTNTEIIWVSTDPVSNAKYVAVINVNDKIVGKTTLNLSELGLDGTYNVRDLWIKKNLGKVTDQIQFTINPHGCKLYKLYK